MAKPQQALTLTPMPMQYKDPTVHICPHCKAKINPIAQYHILSRETEKVYCDKMCLILAEAEYDEDWERVKYDGRIMTEDQFMKHMEVRTYG